jgi:hypothetical protein
MDVQQIMADAAYFKALEAAKKLNDQVEYFRAKDSPNREKMVDLAMVILDAQVQLLEKMRLDYRERRDKVEKKRTETHSV